MSYKDLSKQEARQLATNRYERMKGKFPFSVAKLETCEDFISTFKGLKAKNYPDWLIYMCVCNEIVSHRLNYDPKHRDIQIEQWSGVMRKAYDEGEAEDDMEVPCSLFTDEQMEQAIDRAISSFLMQQGYEIRRRTPNLKKLRQLAISKYNYFGVDAPHDKMFSFE